MANKKPVDNDILPVYRMAVELGVFTASKLREETQIGQTLVTTFVDYLNRSPKLARKHKVPGPKGKEYEYTLTSEGKGALTDALDRLDARAKEDPRPT